MARLVDSLAGYVPTFILRKLRDVGGSSIEIAPDRFRAAVMFADVSGSTTLATRLAERGPLGAEQLGHVFNTFFNRLIEITTTFGGDVATFAGDGLLALWPATTDSDLTTATLRAAECGREALSALNDFVADGENRLSLHVGIGAGDVVVIGVGGRSSHLEFVSAGPGIVQGSNAQRLARSGEIVLSAEAWLLVRDRCAGDVLPTGDVKLTDVPAQATLAPVEPIAISDAAESVLRACVPGFILDRLLAGHAGWLDELRPITVLFIHLPDLGLTSDFARAQAVVDRLEEVLTRFEGYRVRLGVDDKGPTAICAFGLPPRAHADDTTRALGAALEARATLTADGQRCSIGVATGRVFCGEIGNARRRAYTLVGDALHLAVRLMEASDGEILADATTYRAARGNLIFEPQRSLSMKGIEDRAVAYRLVETRPRRVRASSTIVGRDAERSLLYERLERLQSGEHAGVVVIEGEPGIGKSKLIEDLLARAAADGLTPLVGSGDVVARSTPYHLWRSIFSQVFALDALPEDTAVRRAHVLSHWTSKLRPGAGVLTPSDGEQHAAADASFEFDRLAPLLGAVLPLDWPEDDYIATMSADARVDNTRELLIRVLQDVARTNRLLLVVEDAHWLDSASLALLRLVSRRVHPIFLAITSRPPEGESSADYLQFVQDQEITRVSLGGLTQTQVTALVCQRLGVATLPEAVANLIQEHAEGHPFYAEELAFALRDTGQIVISSGICEIPPDATAPSSLVLPDTLRGIVTSRIDRLSPPEQLSIKVASAIGRTFSARTLSDVYPIREEKERIFEHLATMERLDLVSSDPQQSMAYRFKHAITQEVAYDLMLYAQRRQLHRALATHYERDHVRDLPSYYPLLAHHWSRALMSPRIDVDATHKAIDYLERAADQASQTFANAEVVRFLSEAIRLRSSLPDQDEPATRARLARWERALGEARFRMGQVADARAHLLRALELSGYPAATTRRSLVASFFAQSGRQLLHRLFPSAFVGRVPEGARDIVRDASRTYDLLALMSFIAAERLAAVVGYLRSLNLAELGGPSRELVSSSAAMGILVGAVGLARIADGYFRRALATAQKLEDRESLARAWFSHGYYLIGRADWKNAGAALARSIVIYEELGDRRWVETARLNRTNLEGYLGQFAHCMASYQEVQTLARQRGDVQAEAWALVGQANMRLMLGETDAALRTLDELDRCVAHSFASLSDPGSEIDALGIRAMALVRHGEWTTVPAAIDATLLAIERASTPIYHARTGYEHAAAAAVALLESRETTSRSERSEGIALAQRALRFLGTFSRSFPMAKPAHLIRQGTFEWLIGNRRRAHRNWIRGLETAQRLEMPYERGIAHFEMGRHLDLGDPSHRDHLLAAIQIFADLGAAYDLDCARAVLESASNARPDTTT